jgi:hypothetical protein
MEILLDHGNPLHWIVVIVLLVSGALTAWLGVRDGLLRRRMRTNSGTLEGGSALAAGLLYLAFGVAGVAGGVWFIVRAW